MALLSHLALVLACQWNVSTEAWVGYKRANANSQDMHSWTHCLVLPPGTASHQDMVMDMCGEERNGGGSGNGTTSVTGKSGKGGSKSFGRKSRTRAVTNASTDGRTEIVKVNMSMNTNKTPVATITYEEIVFRCCLDEHGNAGFDEEMDSIWYDGGNKHDGNGTFKSSEKDAPIPMTMEERQIPAEGAQARIMDRPRSTSLFHRLHYPIDLPLSFYLQQWNGHTSSSTLQSAIRIYSQNKLLVNLPPFADLLTQQLLAPFFLFQLFCVLLWCLDEYWYYALFTLFTLVLFECTVAYTRLKNLQRLRETLRPAVNVWVWRDSLWGMVSSQDLVTGDVISLSSTSDAAGYGHGHGHGHGHHSEGGMHIPCDLLLIKGSAVLNEAMLTGESVPQMKESIDIVASALNAGEGDIGNRQEPVLDMEDATFKKAILFGGTLLVNHSNASNAGAVDTDGEGVLAEESSSSIASKIPPSPDDGCLALVLRTGFDTQQGSLLRTMVHTSTKSQSDGVNTKDTFIFIVILLCCAVLSSSVVLHHGWHDPTRNRFKLILHVIIIITSVVPPELPMELSLAVTSSLSDLVRRCSVYCTEPFRIPLAGMVDTCCFDKTGAFLTKMLMKQHYVCYLPF